MELILCASYMVLWMLRWSFRTLTLRQDQPSNYCWPVNLNIKHGKWFILGNRETKEVEVCDYANALSKPSLLPLGEGKDEGTAVIYLVKGGGPIISILPTIPCSSWSFLWQKSFRSLPLVMGRRTTQPLPPVLIPNNQAKIQQHRRSN